VNTIGALFEPAALGLITVAQPANLVVLVAGVLVGAVLTWLAGRLRSFAGVVPLALMAPLAQALEPLAGVALLTGLLCGTGAVYDEKARQFSIQSLVWTIGLMAVAGLIMLLTAPWLGATFRTFKAVDRVWLSVAAAVLALAWAWDRHASGYQRTVAPALLLVGLALPAVLKGLGAVQIDAASVALGLLGLGPLAILICGIPGARVDVRGIVPATILPWFALGLPVTAAAALMADALFGQGLSAGPQMLLTRPKIGWGIWAAGLLGCILASILTAGLHRVRLSPSLRREQIVAGVLLLAACGVLVVRGIVASDAVVIAAAAVVGFGIIRAGFDPAPLITGLVISQLCALDLGRAVAGSGASGLMMGVHYAPLALLVLAAVLAATWVSRPSRDTA
jgi:TctA family transporter